MPDRLYPNLPAESPDESVEETSGDIPNENVPHDVKSEASPNSEPEKKAVHDAVVITEEPSAVILPLELEDHHPYRDPQEADSFLPVSKSSAEKLERPSRGKRKSKNVESSPEAVKFLPVEKRSSPLPSLNGDKKSADRSLPEKSPDRRTPGKDGTISDDSTLTDEDGRSPYEKVRWWLYLTEIFGRWGDRMWMFTAPLFLYELFPSSLLIPAIHGLITGVCVILLGAVIGEWVDKTPRLRAVQTALIIQNSSVALGSLLLTFTFVYSEEIPTNWKYLCVAGFTVFGVIGDCASVAMHIIVEKDWIVVIADGKRTQLADMNATIRRIDLICQILSPVIISQIMTFSHSYIGTIVVSVWNVTSMIFEYSILLHIYHLVPKLANPKEATLTSDPSTPKPLHRKVFKSCFAVSDGWKIYFKNRVAPAGVGLAFLYMTVMSFGGVTNSYVRSQGLTESVISVMAGFGAITGIAGTFVFPVLRAKVGLERTGLFALGAQLASLSLCVVSIWLPGSPFNMDEGKTKQGGSGVNGMILKNMNLNVTESPGDLLDVVERERKWITKPTDELPSVVIFLLGMILARFGLWMADLTINQLLQENVAERERGTVGGVQNAMNRFMDMLKFVLVIMLPKPETFGILIIISFLFVFFGHCCYAYYSYRTRGHLLPHCGKKTLGMVNQNIVVNMNRDFEKA